MQPAVLGSRPPGGLPRCLGRLPRRERHESRPRDDRPRWRTHAGGGFRGRHRRRAASRLPSAQTVRRASAFAPSRWRGRPRAAGRRHACRCWRAACLQCSPQSRRFQKLDREGVNQPLHGERRAPESRPGRTRVPTADRPRGLIRIAIRDIPADGECEELRHRRHHGAAPRCLDGCVTSRPERLLP